MNIINILIGIVLLMLGRRLFWLFIACIGFVFGYNLVAEAWTDATPETQMIAGAAIGLLCALLAIFLQKLAIAVGGFIAGGYLALTAMQMGGFQPGLLTLIAVVVAGVIGILLMSLVFDGALIVLSCLAGAAIFMEGITLSQPIQTVVYLALVIAGIIWQSRGPIRPARSEDR